MSLLVAIASTALAQDAEKAEPTVKISGVLFPSYGLDLTEGADSYNEFDIDRSYLRADAKLDDKLAVRLTLDANRLSDVTVVLEDGTEIEAANDPRLRVFVKHAWLEVKPVKDVQLRFGMVDTPFLPFEEQFEGMRYVFKVFLDDVKLESTTDLGISASGKHADGLFGWGVGVYNGEFYTNPEIDAGKSFQARVSVDPLAGQDDLGLPIAAFVDEKLITGEDPRTVAGGMVGFEAPIVLATAQFDVALQGDVVGMGQSVVARADAPDVAFVLARFDRFDPDTATDDDGQIKLWGGLGRDFTKNVSLALTYERAMVEADPDVPVHGVFAHGLAGF